MLYTLKEGVTTWRMLRFFLKITEVQSLHPLSQWRIQRGGATGALPPSKFWSTMFFNASFVSEFFKNKAQIAWETNLHSIELPGPLKGLRAIEMQMHVDVRAHRSYAPPPHDHHWMSPPPKVLCHFRNTLSLAIIWNPEKTVIIVTGNSDKPRLCHVQYVSAKVLCHNSLSHL